MATLGARFAGRGVRPGLLVSIGRWRTDGWPVRQVRLDAWVGPCTVAWAWWCPGAVGPAGATAGPTGPRRAPALHRARRVQGAGLISRALLPDDGLCRPAAYCSPPGGRTFLGSFGRRGAVTASSSRLFSGTSSVCLNRDRRSSCVCRQLPTANAVRRPPTQYS